MHRNAALWIKSTFALMSLSTPQILAAKSDELPQVTILETQLAEAYDARLFGGMVEPVNLRKIYPDIQGSIDLMNVKPGQKVRKGELLFRLRPKGAGVDYQLHRVVSPIDGYVTNISKKLGDYIESSTSPMDVATIEHLRIEFEVAESDLEHIKPGMSVYFVKQGTVQSPIDVPATLSYLAKAPSGALPTYSAAADIDCSKIAEVCMRNFPLGAYAKVLLKLNPHPAIRVPVNALFGQRDKVYVVGEGDLLRSVKVKIKGYDGSIAEVESGLDVGLRIVSGYTGKLENGKKVEVLNPKKQETPGESPEKLIH